LASASGQREKQIGFSQIVENIFRRCIQSGDVIGYYGTPSGQASNNISLIISEIGKATLKMSYIGTEKSASAKARHNHFGSITFSLGN